MRARRRGWARRVRRGRSLRSWLAIFSVLLQLFATAGHFHPEDFAFFDRNAGTALALAGGQGGPALPGGGGQPALPAHDDCALCFSLQLAGNSAIPEPILLAAPPAHDVVLRPLLKAGELASAPALSFRSRAPPVA
jgi:hypothetical protein